MPYETVNRFTAEVVKEFAQHSDEEIKLAVAQADTCFEVWKQSAFSQRTVILKRAAALLRLRSDEFARLVTLEMGKLLVESRGEVALSADIIDYYADNAERFLAPHTIPRTEGEALVVNTPLGILFGVEPWTSPIANLPGSLRPTSRPAMWSW